MKFKKIGRNSRNLDEIQDFQTKQNFEGKNKFLEKFDEKSRSSYLKVVIFTEF